MKRNDGITLIALIITIVILIILTAVTINNVMNSNLINLAKGAAENYVEAGKEEEKAIDKMIGIMQGWKVGDDSKIQPGDVVKITDKDNYTDEDGRKATVPAGFKVSTKSSEQLIEDGLVIQDEQGNEFVWVPCYYEEKPAGTADDVQKYEKHTYAGTATGVDDTGDSTPDTGIGNWKTFYYTKFGNNWQDDAASTYGNKSVQDYGGFYIARYEAGWEDTETEKLKEETKYVESGTLEKTKKDITSKKPISKANVFSWNFITQKNAKTVSENMYDSSASVYSKLVDGTAWDTVTNWIATKNVDVNNSSSYGNYLDNGSMYTGWYAEHIWSTQAKDKTGGITGWLYANKFKNGSINLYGERLTEEKWTDIEKDIANKNAQTNATDYNLDTRIEIPTGSFNGFKLKNIYDLAGNMWEWTTEVDYHTRNGTDDTTEVKAEPQFAIFRGGSFSDDSTKAPLSLRFGSRSASTYIYVGTRVPCRALYKIRVIKTIKNI